MSFSYLGPKSGSLAGWLDSIFADWASARKHKEIEWQEDLDNFLAKTDSSRRWKASDTIREKREDAWKSNVFVRLVKQKVVMAYTHINDLILQGGQVPFMLKPNPDCYQEGVDMEAAEKQCEMMRDTIRSQLIACGAEREFMLCTFSMALYGECFAKSPLFTEIETRRWQKIPNSGIGAQYQKVIEKELRPSIAYKSVWNMFVDPEYTNIQDGRGVIERDFVTPYDLRMLIGRPGYDEEAILEVIRRNANTTMPSTDTSTKPPHLRDIPNPDRKIIWLEFWGRVPKKLLLDFWANSDEGTTEHDIISNDDIYDGDEVEVSIVKANDTIIRAIANDSGKRPYRQCCFETILDDVHGIGTARNLVDAQQIINGAYRNAIDNIALSGNVIIGTDDDSLAPGQTRNLYPGKNFRFKAGTDVRRAMSSIRIQNVSGELLDILGLAKQHADEESLIPRIMQGDLAPKKQPDTLGEINLLYQNAGKFFGQVAKNIDEDFLEPIIEDFYEYNMLNPKYAHMQGDFQVHALGFNSFHSKVIKMQNIKQLVALILSDPTGAMLKEVKLRPLLEEIAKSLDLDPAQYLHSDEEMANMEEMQKAAEQEEIQKQLQLQRAQLEMHADVVDKVMDENLQRDLAKHSAIRSMDEKREDAKFERGIVGQVAAQKIAQIFQRDMEGSQKKPQTGG